MRRGDRNVALAHAARARAWRGAHAALAFLLLNAVALTAVAILGDGFPSLHRHLIGARYAADLALALIAYGGYRWLRDRLRR